MSSVSVLLGKCEETLRELAPDSIDSGVVDPPYGLSDAGSTPDFRAMLRAWLDDQVYNTGGKGFMGAEWDAVVPGPHIWRETLRVLKPGAHMAVFSGCRTQDLMGMSLRLAGFEIRDAIDWIYLNGFVKSKKQGEGRGTGLKPAHEPIFIVRKPFKGTTKANVARYGTGAMNIDACRVPAAPGEVIEQHGRGADSAVSKGIYGDSTATNRGQSEEQKLGRWPPNVLLTHGPECKPVVGELFGPWKCQEGCPVAALDAQAPATGAAAAGPALRDPNTSVARGKYKGLPPDQEPAFHGDSGGASRMFPRFDWIADLNDPILAELFRYCPKPSPSERSAGLEGVVAPKQQDATRKEGKPGGDNPRNRGAKERLNHHPTVKPIGLMRWLVKLLTPIGGHVGDFFGGSGTTGCAAVLEDRSATLCELDPEFVAIANARIAYWRTQRT